MKRMTKIITVILIFWGTFSLFGIGESSAGDVMVIGNSGITEKSLDSEKIKEIFLGDIPKWGNNEMVTIVIVEQTEVHKDFLKKYIKRTESQFRNVWRQNLFTGKGKHPLKVDSFDELIEYVSKNQGAIGYVPPDITLPPGVKVLSK